MRTRDGVLLGGALVLALMLQVSLFSHFSVRGVVPNLCLLVVVAAGWSRGPAPGMVLGFIAGLALDLVPPADHLAGRWALALVIVGYVAGRVGRPDATELVPIWWATVVSSFVGTSVFALTGLLLGDVSVGIPGLLEVVLIGVAWDALLAPVVVVPLVRLLSVREGEPAAVAAR